LNPVRLNRPAVVYRRGVVSRMKVKKALLAGASMAATETATTDLKRRTVAQLEAELAQTRAERDAALAREAATAEVLGVINASPGVLAPVFDAMLERAMHLCGAAFGELIIYDGELHQTAATRGVPEAFAEFRQRQHAIPEPGSLGSRVLGGELIIH